MVLDMNSLIDLSSMPEWLLIVLIVVTIWKLIWYGFAIYKALEKKHKIWFVVLFLAAFVLNDAGILAIIYLMINGEKRAKKKRR